MVIDGQLDFTLDLGRYGVRALANRHAAVQSSHCGLLPGGTATSSVLAGRMKMQVSRSRGGCHGALVIEQKGQARKMCEQIDP
jgi:hypothetical protein